MKTLTAVLFVGGESRRMGRDKATLVLDGEPLWARQLRVLHELGPAKVMISARKKPAWCPNDIEVIIDEPPSRGPLSGLAAALKKIKTTHLLAMAVDLPEMTSVHLKKLWALAEPGIGVVPTNGMLFESLCAFYPLEFAETAGLALLSEDVSLRRLIETLARQKKVNSYKVTKFENRLYQNVNTPEQWRGKIVASN